MSYKTNSVTKWSSSDFMSFISSLNIKGKPYNDIQKALNENGLSAHDIIKSQTADIKDLFGINIILARKIKKQLVKLNVGQITNPQPSTAPRSNPPSSSSNSSDQFEVHLRGKQGGRVTLRKLFTKNSKISDVAISYKDQECVDLSYKVEKIIFIVRGKTLAHNNTLGYYGIIDSHNLITVIFKTKGGAMMAANDEDRERYIHFKKYGLQATSLPDELIGYDDNDGVYRALLECGKHAMAAETMFMYIASSLSSNLNQTEIVCPGKGCGKILNWQICTQIADMNSSEYMKWTDVIEKRAMKNYKRCPHCEAYCLRDDGVAIFRMRCIACKGSDWCWECAQAWKGSSLSMCCNQNCSLILETNDKLKNCDMVKVGYTNVEMPQFRACPRCLTFIEYTTACKHMICSGCDKSFCFVCLGLQDSSGKYPCGEHNDVCKMAPKQEFK